MHPAGASEQPNEKGEEERDEEKKFAANSVSLMNAFFVSGKQTGSGTHPAWELRREINKFRTFAKGKDRDNTVNFSV